MALTTWPLFGRDGERGMLLDRSETGGQPVTIGIDERRGAGARDRVDAAMQWDLSQEDRSDHPRFDCMKIRRASLMRVAIPFDQTGAFNDLERKLARAIGGFGDQLEPVLDGRLFALVAKASPAPRLELRQQPKAQV